MNPEELLLHRELELLRAAGKIRKRGNNTKARQRTQERSVKLAQAQRLIAKEVKKKTMMRLTYGNCQRRVLEALMNTGCTPDEAMAIWNAAKLHRFEPDGTESQNSDANGSNDAPSESEASTPTHKPDQCLLRIKGGIGEPVLFERCNGVNDQFHPGEIYVIPQQHGKEVKMIRARCIDWFTVLQAPLITVFVFEQC